MLARTKEFLKENIANKLTRWRSIVSHGKYSVSAGRCCIAITSEKIFFIYARQDNEKDELVLSESYDYKRNTDIGIILSKTVEKYKLKGVPCSWVLQFDQYQLMQVDALPVTPAEFQTAIRWKMKDTLRFPIEDAVIDHFPIPIPKTPTAVDMIMLVVAKVSFLQPISKQILASGLKLESIDINQLCFKSITAFYEQESENKTISLISLQDEGCELIITHKQQLYFIRRLNFGLKSIENLQDANATNEIDDLLNAFALDVQRSFDYFQSQWRLSEPSKILLVPIRPLDFSIEEPLSKALNIAVSKIDLNHFFTNLSKANIAPEGIFCSLVGCLLNYRENVNARERATES